MTTQPNHTTKGDWLNVTFPTDNLEKVRALMVTHLGEPEERPFGIHRYRQSAIWAAGGMLAWSDGRPESLLSLNGDSVDQFPGESLWQLYRDLYELGAKGTRIDLAFDDYTRSMYSMDDVNAAALSGNFSGFRVVQPVRELKMDAGGAMRPTGYGVTFGRKGKDGGGRQVIFYDKGLESSGKIDALRIEARFFKERAEVAFECLASSLTYENFVRKVRAYIGGAIDFVERTAVAHGHVHRMLRLRWWEKLLAVLDSAPVVVHRVVPPLQRVVEYAKFAYRKTFAAVVQRAEDQGHDGEAVLIGVVRQMLAKGKAMLRANPLPVSRSLVFDVGIAVGPTRWGMI